MAVETATYVGQLNATFPAGGEPIAQGDDHLRLIKTTLQNTFPSLNSPWTTAGDLLWVGKAGDQTMAGKLTAAGYLTSIAQGSEANALTRKDYVDAQDALRLPLSGGSLTGLLYAAPGQSFNTIAGSVGGSATGVNFLDSGGSPAGGVGGLFSAGSLTGIYYGLGSSPFDQLGSNIGLWLNASGNSTLKTGGTVGGTLDVEKTKLNDVGSLNFQYAPGSYYPVGIIQDTLGQLNFCRQDVNGNWAASMLSIDPNTLTATFAGPVINNSTLYCYGAITMSPTNSATDGQPIILGAPSYPDAAVLSGTHVVGNWVGATLNAQGQAFTFQGSGTAYAPVGWQPASDGRVKKERQPITGALEKVKQLLGQTYTRPDVSDSGKRYAGLIAQDVEKVLPEAVSVSGDLPEGYEDDADSTGFRALSYDAVTALLVEAIKELAAEVELLKAAQ